MSGPTKYACILCGHRDEDVRIALVRWEQPIGDRTFEAIPRCSDRISCRQRVEDVNGERWPLIDASRETFEATPDRRSTQGPLASTLAAIVSPPVLEASGQLELDQPAPIAEQPADPVEDVAWLGL